MQLLLIINRDNGRRVWAAPACDRFFIVQTPLKSDPSGSGIGAMMTGLLFMV
jgi:hypothetical protein